jgi:hypothetical protein
MFVIRQSHIFAVRRATRGFAVAVVTLLCNSMAHAADWYTGAKAAKPASDWIVAVDASTTVSSNGTAFASVSATMPLDKTLDVSGSRLRLEGLAGTFKFNSTTTGDRIRGDQEGASILAGYEWKSTGQSLAMYGGLEVRNSQFTPVETGAGTPGAHQGLKATVEYYTALSPRSMLFAYGSYSTIDNAYFGQVKLGIAPAGGVYVGPEFAALGDDYYQQWRVGGHVTGIQMGAMQFGVSAGYQLEKSGKGGAYGAVNVRGLY